MKTKLSTARAYCSTPLYSNFKLKTSFLIKGTVSLLLCFCSIAVVQGQCPANPVLSITASDRNGTQGSWTVPAGGPYKIKITAKGANGGQDYFSGNLGGNGATMIGEFIVNSGDVLEAIAGGQGQTNIGPEMDAGAGGAGSAVRIGNTLLVVAGGGGGGAPLSNGSPGSITINGSNGGSGSYGNNPYPGGSGGINGNAGNGSAIASGGGGAFSGAATVTDAVHVTTGGGAGFGGIGGNSNGYNYGGTGFGGGGASPRTTLGANSGGGGGGGYSGGGGGGSFGGAGGGGGSYNTGTNQNNTGGANAGGGQVIIECLGVACPPGNIAYVNANATGADNGTSWDDAFTNLQDALALSSTCSNITEIWVATGTYKPTGTTDRTVSFAVPSGVTLYGGFAGTETLLNERNIAANVTVLSGDIGVGGVVTDNSFHVISLQIKNNIRIDGFTVRDGFIAPADAVDSRGFAGAGIFMSRSGNITLDHLRIIDNSAIGGSSATTAEAGPGGGVYFERTTGATTLINSVVQNNHAGFGGGIFSLLANSVTVQNTIFRSNTALYGGGGLLHWLGESYNVVGCLFENNLAVSDDGQNGTGGGAQFQGGESTVLTNCVFSNNRANGVIDEGGGGMTVYGGIINLVNCTMSGNSTSSTTNADGNGISLVDGGFGIQEINLINTIVWGLPALQVYNGGTINYDHSFVKGISGSDPLFVNSSDPDGTDNLFGTADDGVMIANNSPAINAGTNSGAPNIDVIGNPRALTAADPADIGAYEFQVVCPPSNIAYVNADATGANNGTSWADAFTKLQDALALTNSCSGINQIWVAQGTYYATSDGNRSISFSLKTGIEIYGGFSGIETARSQRDFRLHLTILSGNINNPNSSTDNTDQIVQAQDVDATAILDGFIIKDAYGDAGSNRGCGINLYYASPVIRNCIFRDNFGTGFSITSGGVAAYMYKGSPVFESCTFYNNDGSDGNESSIESHESNPTIDNCVIANNSGGIIIADGSAIIRNSTIANNVSAGLYEGYANVQVVNTIIKGNDITSDAGALTINHSVTPSAFSGTGNTTADPLFANESDPDGDDNIFGTSDDGLIPTCGSSAVNTGSNASVTAPTDMNGNTRIQQITVDMGAYETDITVQTWYKDFDGDTYADGLPFTQCADPGTGFVHSVTGLGDCDDNNAAIKPTTVWYKDADNDNYSDGTTQIQCARPLNYKLASELIATSGDCDDNNAAIIPTVLWYKDADNDNYSDGTTQLQCSRPTGYKLATELTATSGDCDDNNAAIKPTTVWYKDADNDNYSNGTTQTQCSRPTGYKLATELTTTSGDCDDNNAAIKPTTVWYKDADNDNYSNGTTQTQCSRPTGYKLATELTATSGDCNDANANIKPGAVEICGNSIDDNCNGQVDENCNSCVNVTVSTSTISCYGGLATITVYASGGKAPYKYKLSGRLSFQLTNYFIVAAGTYSVTVMDKTGCTKTVSNIVITQPPLLTLTLVQKKDVTCRNGSNGSISVSAGGGTSPYSYKLNSGSYTSNSTFQNLKAGIYTITAKDARGCYRSMSVTVKNGSGSCSSYALTGKTLELFNARLSPNPAVNEFTLQVSGSSSEPVNIRVVDIYGKTRYITKGAVGQSYKFGQHFAAGVYIIEIIQGENRRTIKAIKQ